MDVIAHLFVFVSENFVLAALEVAFHEATEESVQFDACVIRASEATAAVGAGGEIKIAAVFLDHHIGSDFAGAEERVFGLVDGKSFRDTVLIRGISIIPARG